MPRQLITYFICISMVVMNVIPPPVYADEFLSSSEFNEAELLEKYPDAKVIRVSPEEYLALEKRLQQRGYRQSEVVPLQLAQNNAARDTAIAEPVYADAVSSRDCVDNKGDESTGEDSFRVMLDITDDMMNSRGSSSDSAAVLFVIVGTVVVIIWSLYVFKYLYDVSLGNAPCGRWNEFAVVGSSASTGDTQHARFNGLRYSAGIRDGLMDVGVSLELGEADILLSEVGVLELKGRYWLLGPVLRWRLSQGINPSYFQTNFVAGSTEHDEVGLLARASLGLLFGVGDSLQLGLNWGAMNIDLNENQGVITQRDQYHYFYAINMGFRF